MTNDFFKSRLPNFQDRSKKLLKLNWLQT